MPKKPTSTYGYIAFGKAGTVWPLLQRLPDDKAGQEIRIAQSFLADFVARPKIGMACKVLDEDDHDFCVVDSAGQVVATCQATELLQRDYCSNISKETYFAGVHKEIVYDEAMKIWSVDPDKQLQVIQRKIESKLAKYYAKPRVGEFWLLIWSVSGHPLTSALHAGRKIVSPSVEFARRWLADHSTGPFDRIYLYFPGVRPEQVWPVDEAQLLQSSDY